MANNRRGTGFTDEEIELMARCVATHNRLADAEEARLAAAQARWDAFSAARAGGVGLLTIARITGLANSVVEYTTRQPRPSYRRVRRTP